MDLLDGLLIEDANDEAARELRDEIILLRQLAMEEEKAAEAAAAGETDSREADFRRSLPKRRLPPSVVVWRKN